MIVLGGILVFAAFFVALAALALASEHSAPSQTNLGGVFLVAAVLGTAMGLGLVLDILTEILK